MSEPMPESCSDLGAEGQVTEQWIAVFADEENRRVVTVLREIKRMDLDPLSRRVEELEAAAAGLLAAYDAIGLSHQLGQHIETLRALLKEGER